MEICPCSFLLSLDVGVGMNFFVIANDRDFFAKLAIQILTIHYMSQISWQ